MKNIIRTQAATKSLIQTLNKMMSEIKTDEEFGFVAIQVCDYANKKGANENIVDAIKLAIIGLLNHDINRDQLNEILSMSSEKINEIDKMIKLGICAIKIASGEPIINLTE
jgi:hypothetical protein